MPSTEELIAIEHACTRVLLKSMSTFDDRDFKAFADLFTVDAVFVRANQPSEPLVGREAILVALNARPTDRLTRHLCTNIEIEVLDASRAKGRCYLLSFSTSTSLPDHVGGRPADSIQRMGEYHDQYVRTAEGWKIARRDGKVVMVMGEKK
jgi:ketosteroid isomerase-like protein